MTAQERAQALAVMEQLDEQQRYAALMFMRYLIDNGIREVQSEPMTEDEISRVEHGRRWLASRGGKGIPMEEVLADFGLTLDDLGHGG